MDGLAAADLQGVVAPLNFLEPMAEKPVAYNYDPPPGVPMRTGRYSFHDVRVHDARAVAGNLSLDREGFERALSQERDRARSTVAPQGRFHDLAGLAIVAREHNPPQGSSLLSL